MLYGNSSGREASRSPHRESAEAHALCSSSLALALWPSVEVVAVYLRHDRFRHPVFVDVKVLETRRIDGYHVLVTRVLVGVGG